MAEDSLAAGRAFIDAFNSTDYDAIRSLMTDDIKYEEFGTQRTMSGADEVIDYTREDFTRRGVRYDLIFDVPGLAVQQNRESLCCRKEPTDGTSTIHSR